MGRTGKWLRSLFSSKSSSAKNRKKFVSGDESSSANPYGDAHLDANKHAIAVAAATAAVAEAALAAAQAAAEVVRLTTGGTGGGSSGRNNDPVAAGDRRRVGAVVKIQSAFRAYLARRALRALKGLVKLQALVRGHIVRKQSADMLRRMQAMARIQARASAHRSYITEPTHNFNYSRHPVLPCPQSFTNRRNYDQHSNYAKHGAYTHKRNNPRLQSSGNESSQQTSNWLHHWMDQYSLNNHHEDERTDKILEIDTWKPRQPARQTEGTTFATPQYFSWNEAARLSAKLQKPNPSISSEELSSKCPPEGDQGTVRTAENSPRVQSATSRQSRGPFTPTKSECSRSYFGDYLSHPSYMANTASSRAKVRSQSAPKQRMQLEELGMNHGLWESDTNSEAGFSLQGSYRTNTAYLHYPSQLRRQATPARGNYTGFSSTYGHGI